MRNIALLKRDVDLLRQQFEVVVNGNFDEIIIRDFPLPENFDRRLADVLLLIPSNFPLHPPRIFLPRETKIKFPNSIGYGQFHSFNYDNSFWERGWGYMCFHIRWSPAENPGLIKFLQFMENALSMVYADIESLV